MRVRILLLAGAFSALAISAAYAETPDEVRAQRQESLKGILTYDTASDVAIDRGACLSGKQAAAISRGRSVGADSLPDVADYCITVLIRSARDGVRSRLWAVGQTAPTPASEVDNGFMEAYAKSEPKPADLPTMANVKPIAQRCFAQAEPNINLCHSAGYVYGLRAVHGETVTVE